MPSAASCDGSTGSGEPVIGGERGPRLRRRKCDTHGGVALSRSAVSTASIVRARCSLAGMVALLLWAVLSSTALVYGAAVAAQLARAAANANARVSCNWGP